MALTDDRPAASADIDALLANMVGPILYAIALVGSVLAVLAVVRL